MNPVSLIFWAAVALIAYTIVVYPIFAWLRAVVRSRPIRETGTADRRVTVIVAAYNEQETIAERIENLLAADYPRDLLQVVVASDGSTDATHQIVERFADQGVVLVALPRRGKGQALNDAIPYADGEILVFTDANTHFPAPTIRELVRPFADPSVGGVAGDQVYTRDGTASLTADGERAYWSLDRQLKRWQSRGGSVTSATGAIYAIRRDLYQDVPVGAMDDFVISSGVVARGFRLVFAPAAIAVEPVAVASRVEWSRKLRVMTQGLRSVGIQRRLLNPFRYGVYSLQLFTHKVLRRLLWLPLILIVLSTPLLWNQSLFYRGLLLAEIAFLLLAGCGLMLRPWRMGRAKLFTVPFYLCLINVAAAIASVRAVFGRQVELWEPERHTSETSLDDVSEQVSA